MALSNQRKIAFAVVAVAAGTTVAMVGYLLWAKRSQDDCVRLRANRVADVIAGMKLDQLEPLDAARSVADAAELEISGCDGGATVWRCELMVHCGVGSSLGIGLNLELGPGGRVRSARVGGLSDQ